jgi:hypothetical protein
VLRLSVVIVRHVVGPRERGRASEGRITRGQNGEGGKVLQTHEKSGKRLLVEARLERRRAVRRSGFIVFMAPFIGAACCFARHLFLDIKSRCI